MLNTTNPMNMSASEMCRMMSRMFCTLGRLVSLYSSKNDHVPRPTNVPPTICTKKPVLVASVLGGHVRRGTYPEDQVEEEERVLDARADERELVVRLIVQPLLQVLVIVSVMAATVATAVLSGAGASAAARPMMSVGHGLAYVASAGSVRGRLLCCCVVDAECVPMGDDVRGSTARCRSCAACAMACVASSGSCVHLQQSQSHANNG